MNEEKGQPEKDARRAQAGNSSPVTVHFKVAKWRRSRFGTVQVVSQERRRCTMGEVDRVVAEFRGRYDVIEVTIVKDS